MIRPVIPAIDDALTQVWTQIESGSGHVAVHDATGQHTYGDFAVLMEKIAAAVTETAEHPKVFIYAPQGVGAYASMFATHHAGGYYATANLEWPLARQQQVYDLFQPHVVIFDSSAFPLPHSMSNAPKTVDLADLPSARLTSPRPAHDLAYVMYTSGSTGTPKGVMIPRTALANYTDWAIREMAVTRDDRWSQHPNIAFDLSVLDIYGALCGGASLHPLIARTERMFPARFIRDRKLTIWDSVPSVIDVMRAADEINPEHFASLRLITFCGEPLLREHVQAIFNAKPDIAVHNTYGPTEATVSCTLLRLHKDTYGSASRTSMAFGEPIQNMGLHLVDGPTPDEGEIVISGPQLARGYWQQPAQTAKAFVEMNIDGTMTPVYRTGDWGIREGGHNYFAIRIDRQIKIRGHRVELNEIDNAAREAGVRSACTVFVENALHCFVETEGIADFDAIRESMGQKLPPYAMPSSFRQLDSLPRNANEKIDANALIERVKNG